MNSVSTKKEYVLPDVSDLKFDDKKHAYSKDGKLYSGVTTVISKTSSKDNLIQWAANMCADYIKNGAKAYVELNSASGQKPLVITEALIEEARTAHARHRDGAASKGTDTHALVEEYINKCILLRGGVPDPFAGVHPNSKEEEKAARVIDSLIQPFIQWSVDNVDRFLAAEQRLYSEKYGYAGTADFIAVIDGKLTIGDLKTFPKLWSADAFIQMGAYSLAWNELTGEKPQQSVVVKMCDPNDPRIKKYGGKPFAAYPRYALEEDEDMFLTRLKMYRYNENFVSPKE